MATSTVKKQAYFKDNPITLNSDATGKMTIARNHCVRYGNIFQFSILIEISTVYNGYITDAGAVPPPKTYDPAAVYNTSVIDAFSLDNGRIRITKDRSLYMGGTTKTGQYLYCCTYIIDD